MIGRADPPRTTARPAHEWSLHEQARRLRRVHVNRSCHAFPAVVRVRTQVWRVKVSSFACIAASCACVQHPFSGVEDGRAQTPLVPPRTFGRGMRRGSADAAGPRDCGAVHRAQDITARLGPARSAGEAEGFHSGQNFDVNSPQDWRRKAPRFTRAISTSTHYTPSPPFAFTLGSSGPGLQRALQHRHPHKSPPRGLRHRTSLALPTPSQIFVCETVLSFHMIP